MVMISVTLDDDDDAIKMQCGWGGVTDEEYIVVDSYGIIVMMYILRCKVVVYLIVC